MLKYLKGQPLVIPLAGKTITLPCPLVSDFDLLNPILRAHGSQSLELNKLKSQAVMELADRLVDRAELGAEGIQFLQAWAVDFYFSFGIELDIYLIALFPQPRPDEEKQDESQGSDTPLASDNQKSGS